MNSVFKSILLLMLAGGALVFAGGGLERPPGEPPHGVAVQSDAPGTKLSGVISIELYNLDDEVDKKADGRVVLRLRKNKDFATLFADVCTELNLPARCLDTADPANSQIIIIGAMKPLIIDRFFGNNDGDTTNDNEQAFDLRVKSVEEFGRVAATTLLTGDSPAHGSIFILADVVLAVR